MKLNLNKGYILLDGGMGTILQKSNEDLGPRPDLVCMTRPELVSAIHRQYIQAGSQVICTSTFGANRYKLAGCPWSASEVVETTVKIALEDADGKAAVALDIGPLGELLEPMGQLTFEDAYDAFCEMAVQGEKSGADLIFLETMTDLYEIKAAILAVKENTNLPIFASMTFEETGRTFTGVSIKCMAETLESLGVDAMGINCSLGPKEIYPMGKELCMSTDIPVLIKPNAGLPDPEDGRYKITPEAFVAAMEDYKELGVAMVGGCCGTTPEFIRLLKESFQGERIQPDRSGREKISPIGNKKESKCAAESKKESCVCSATKAITLDHVVVIGERINPTGKKTMKEALLRKDYPYLLSLAVEQMEAGAEILDVNVGIPEIDEAVVLPKVVKALQAVTDLPLQIDSSNPEAIEAALRVYNGKAIVNSVSGEDSSLESILPIVKKYGAAVIGLTLGENGIPSTAEGRFAIAEKILNCAVELGIPKRDVFIDCLTLTVSAQQAEAAETLKAIRMVRQQLGLHTTLGVSNISFGLPNRPLINRTFLTLAMENGLDLPIIDPNDVKMMDAIRAFELLHNGDLNGANFIERFGGNQQEAETEAMKKVADSAYCSDRKKVTSVEVDMPGDPQDAVSHAVKKGLKKETADRVSTLLETNSPMDVINQILIPALNQVGQRFEKGTVFLPEMMQAAAAAQSGFEVIKANLDASGQSSISKGNVVLATVKGDIHDIGKNIVRVIMDNFGFHITDLGRDVPAETIVETVLEQDIQLVGLSALMTTTLQSMEATIAALRQAKPQCKIMVGGAVLTPEYAEKIGADFYCKDAMKSVEVGQGVFEV